MRHRLPPVLVGKDDDALLDQLLDQLPNQTSRQQPVRQSDPSFQPIPPHHRAISQDRLDEQRSTRMPYQGQEWAEEQYPSHYQQYPEEWGEERPARRAASRHTQRNRGYSRSRRLTTYDRVTKGAALIVAFALVGLIWWAGAYFTLRWLSSVGLALASAGALAYLIPGSITLIEIGLWPQKAGSAISRGFWIAILLFDVATTAAGVVVYTKGNSIAGAPLEGPLAWLIGGLAGLLFALMPERAGRALWREFRELF